ncbi:hypothetical protein V8B97DRAFT_790605 [Scleroderma yunnanense]
MSNGSSSSMSTTAQLRYSLPPPDGSKPYIGVMPDPVTGRPSQNWLDDFHTIQIEDVRGREDQYTLDDAGFQYYRHPAKHTTFLNDEEIKEEYYPESIELIKKLTGATRVVIFAHVVRRRRPPRSDDAVRHEYPAGLVHVDQTRDFAHSLVHKHLSPIDAEVFLGGRFQTVSLWRPIAHPAIDWPLALCDSRSVNPERDLMATTLIYPDRKDDTNCVKYNSGHRWVYKSAMEPEDFVILKTFDSDPTASVAVHSAFQDPMTPEGTPYRQSIELRVLLYFGEN